MCLLIMFASYSIKSNISLLLSSFSLQQWQISPLILVLHGWNPHSELILGQCAPVSLPPLMGISLDQAESSMMPC